MSAKDDRPLGDWEQDHANVVVDCVNLWRQKRGWTIADLQERLGLAGWPVGLGTLNGILGSRKRRQFTIGELMAFARALEVSPTTLIVGLPVSSELPAGPLLREARAAGEVAMWFVGQGLAGVAPVDEQLNVLLRIESDLAAMRGHAAFVAALIEAGVDPEDPIVQTPVGRVRTVWAKLQAFRTDAGSRGLFVPDLPGELQPYEREPGMNLPVPLGGLHNLADLEEARSEVRNLPASLLPGL